MWLFYLFTGYVENSLKNKEKIFKKIIHAAVTDTQPSTSTDKNDLFLDLEIDEQELIAIDILNQTEKTDEQTPHFTTARNAKILVPNNKEAKVAKHFTTKPPVKIVFEKSQSEPPSKKMKLADGKANMKEQTLQAQLDEQGNGEMNSAFKPNSHVKYNNCVFHGNITNNFYCYKK